MTVGDIQVLLREIFAALPAYQQAELYSRGKVTEVWSNKRIAHILRGSANHYRVNIARRPIDAVLNRLKILSVSAESEGGQENDAATERLNTDVWKANRLNLRLKAAIDKAETYGDAYLVCWPRPEDEDGGVDVMVNDPKYLRVIYDPERPTRVLYSGRTWLDSDGFRRVTLWRDGPVRERYISKEKETGLPAEGYTDADFRPLMDDPDDDESWREDLALGLGNPVFHLATADEGGYGVPMHEQVYGTQNMLTKQIATMMEATDGYGFPFRFQLAKAGTTGNVASMDDDWDDDDSNPATGSAPRAPRGQKVNPGEIAKFWDTDSIGQLAPADVANFLEPISMTLRLSSVVSTTPLNYFDPSAASASGESKKEQDKPLVSKASDQLEQLDPTISAALKYALALLGVKVPGVVIAWAPVESVDDQAEVTLAKSRQEAGVPLKRTLVDLGYPEKDVEQWISEATPDDQVLEHRVALLKELAQAAQALGAAASLGVIDEAVARMLITRMVVGTELPALPEPTGKDDDGEPDDGPGES
jgi:hypothetical protein